MDPVIWLVVLAVISIVVLLLSSLLWKDNDSSSQRPPSFAKSGILTITVTKLDPDHKSPIPYEEAAEEVGSAIEEGGQQGTLRLYVPDNSGSWRGRKNYGKYYDVGWEVKEN